MNITIPFDDLPEAKEWKNGELYDITIRQMSKDSMGATFEIIGSAGDSMEDDIGDETDESETYYRIRP